MITTLKFPMTFNTDRLKADLASALGHDWIAHYNTAAYSGDWNSIALMSSGGKAVNIQAFPIANVPVVETEVMNECTYFREVLESFGFAKTSVRLLRLHAGAEIKPHKDYCLGYEDGVFRIHIPIVTNPDVEFIVAGQRVIMDEGTCWYINANEEHSVANRGAEDRIHLVIDGERNAWTDTLFFSQAPEESFQLPPMPLSNEVRLQMIEELKKQDTPTARTLIATLLDELNRNNVAPRRHT